MDERGDPFAMPEIEPSETVRGDIVHEISGVMSTLIFPSIEYFSGNPTGGGRCGHKKFLHKHHHADISSGTTSTAKQLTNPARRVLLIRRRRLYPCRKVGDIHRILNLRA